MFKSQSSSRRLSAVLATAALVLSGIAGVSAPAYASDTKKVTISGFAPNSVALTASMKQRINKFIEANDEYIFVSCVGFADRAGSPSRNNVLGKGRATAACDQAVSASSEVEVISSRGRWDKIRSGANVRRVEITVSMTASTAAAGYTTYFEYMGATPGIAEIKTPANGSLVLPTPTRPGFEFLGWFNQQYNGTKVGNGGDTYKPNRTRILWAQWITPPVLGGVVGGASFATEIVFTYSIGYNSVDDLCEDANRMIALTYEHDGQTVDLFPLGGNPNQIGGLGGGLSGPDNPCTETFTISLPEPVAAGTSFTAAFAAGGTSVSCPLPQPIVGLPAGWQNMNVGPNQNTYVYGGTLQEGSTTVSISGTIVDLFGAPACIPD